VSVTGMFSDLVHSLPALRAEKVPGCSRCEGQVSHMVSSSEGQAGNSG